MDKKYYEFRAHFAHKELCERLKLYQESSICKEKILESDKRKEYSFPHQSHKGYNDFNNKSGSYKTKIKKNITLDEGNQSNIRMKYLNRLSKNPFKLLPEKNNESNFPIINT